MKTCEYVVVYAPEPSYTLIQYLNDSQEFTGVDLIERTDGRFIRITLCLLHNEQTLDKVMRHAKAFRA